MTNSGRTPYVGHLLSKQRLFQFSEIRRVYEVSIGKNLVFEEVVDVTPEQDARPHDFVAEERIRFVEQDEV